jgi:chemotaxis protein methyltransferase CheR
MSDEKKNNPKIVWKPAAESSKPRFVLKPRKIEREFELSKEEFMTLSDLVYQKTGIVLKDHKINMLYSRLSRRLRTLGLGSFRDYMVFLNGSNAEPEISSLINAITTNLTRFFREEHHFEHLKSVVMPTLITEKERTKDKKIRIWSAGCSSGEEAYSISMVMDEALKKAHMTDMDARILATDIDTNMLQIGRDAFYKNIKLDQIPAPFLSCFSNLSTDNNSFHVDLELRKYISFKELNLISDWPMKGPFDVIFCRNVMIYFDNQTKQKLMERFTSLLKPGGWLYIGHSETLIGADNHLKLHGRTIYQRRF